MLDRSESHGEASLRRPLLATVVGLVPAIAVTYRVDNALVIGVMVLIVSILTSITTNLVAPGVPDRLRFLTMLSISSVFVTLAALILDAYAPAVARRLGIYLWIVVVNSLVLGVSYHEASIERIGRGVRESAATGFAFLVVLVVLSIVREGLGSGTITLVPIGAFDGTIRISAIAGHGAKLLTDSAGGFLLLGYLQALVVLWSYRRKETRP